MNSSQFIHDLNAIILQLKQFFIAFFPKIIVAIAIFFAGLLLARIVRILVNRIIKRIDRFLRKKTSVQKYGKIEVESSSGIISRIMYWIILIIFITAATEILGLPVITTWLSGLVNYMPNILLATIILFSGIISGKLSKDVINSTMTKTGALFGDFLGNLAQYSIVILSVLIAVTQIGVDLEILSALINIVLAAILFGGALAFGLGATTSVGNILACYYLKDRYHEGDFVQIGEHQGRILAFTSTSVVIDTKVGQVTIPAKRFSEEFSILLNKESSHAD